MKLLLLLLKTIVPVCVLLCVLLYLLQEKLIFFPEKLPADYAFHFQQPFSERWFASNDGKKLHGLLFKATDSKGLIFYLHGNAGSLRSWGELAPVYTSLHYDLFIPDYRGYGKSEGSITSEQQMYDDVQMMYNNLKQSYAEKDIVILGYSIGTGPASHLAAANHAALLILQAPYFSLTDLIKHRFPFLPAFLLKYHFPNNLAIKNCRMPVTIFHGTRDEVIYYGSSLKLKELFKPADTLITLEDQGHNGISDNAVYRSELQKLLSN